MKRGHDERDLVKQPHVRHAAQRARPDGLRRSAACSADTALQGWTFSQRRRWRRL